VTGRRIDANEMARLGLVNQVVARKDLMPVNLDFASTLAKLDGEAVRKIKSRANFNLVRIWENFKPLFVSFENKRRSDRQIEF
jgi:enoyl-CoA hydratase/carnithine racemase